MAQAYRTEGGSEDLRKGQDKGETSNLPNEPRTQGRKEAREKLDFPWCDGIKCKAANTSS